MRKPRVRRATVAAATVVGLVAVVSAGCGSDDSGSGSASDGGGVTTLTFAASTFGDPGRGPQLEEWLEQFNASQDEIRVEAASVPYPTFGQTVLTQMGGGEGPDLVRFDMPEFEAASDAGLIAPLDDLIDAGEYELLEQPDRFMVHDDVRHGIIFEASNYAMFYNADLIPEPPTTYEDFFAIAQSLTSGDTFGLAFRQTEAEEAGVWQDIFNYVYGFGGAWSDGEDLTINAPENLEGLQAYKDLYDANVIPRGADAATFRRMFAEGKVAMELNNGGYATHLLAESPDLNFSVAPIPFPERSQGAILAPIVINEASEAKEEAATFITWALEPENQTSLQEILGASSVATATERTPESLQELPFLPTFDELTESSLPQVVLGFEAQTPDIRKIVVQNVIAALQGQVDLQTALDDAQEQATELVG
ncbi:ABC transporter substrate-binding protein [Jiangella mangrovi]|uniref:Multiple sugar transport system substrate-binding protein n=1 Tax=Jiangella mangrovi TaxID=1524084 RepID=A0A7W9GWK3_9ACTN|nr:sugar ABC transporter substrate-binding protein [Jiangella mangrovi]MBB5791094.1 multiple sugar transport system substrate-binding protein [Jiangella mangrovi]